MAIAKVADRANVNGNAAVTTVDLVLSGLTVDNYLIIRTAADNSGGGGAARAITVTNQSGTPIDVANDLAYQRNYDPGAASAGVTVNVIVAKITATSGTVRITYAGSVVQAAQAEEWSGIDLTNPVVGTPVGNDGAASTNLASTTDSSIADGNVAYAAVAIEGPAGDTYTNDSDTTNGSWVALTKRGTTNATADTNMTIAGAYKAVTAAGSQTHNPTNSVARDSTALILELAAAPTLVASSDTGTGVEGTPTVDSLDPPVASFTVTPNPAMDELDVLTLDASASTADSPATIASYRWELVSAPPGYWGNFDDIADPTTLFTPVATEFEEFFAGADGAAWDAGRWSNVYASGAGATATIQGNTGRLSVGGANYTRRVDMAVGTYDDFTLRFSITYDPGAIEQYTGVNFRADAAHTGSGDLRITDNGYYMGWESSRYLVLRKVVAGVESGLTGDLDLGLSSIGKRWFKIVTHGPTMLVFTWLDGTPEPTVPTMAVADGTYTSGRISVQAMSGSNTTTRTFDFEDFVVVPHVSLVTDAFTRADSASSIGGSWSAVRGTWGISSNQAYNVSNPDQGIAIIDTGKTSQEVSVTMSTVPGAAAATLGLWARCNSTALDTYLLNSNTGGTALYRVINDVWTQIGSTNASVQAASGELLRLRVGQFNGTTSSLVAVVGAELAFNTTDGNITSGTYAGLRAAGGSASSARFDDFDVVPA